MSFAVPGGQNMRRRLFMFWAAFRWLPLMFLLAQGLEAPLVAHPSQPIKPIRVWTARTSWYGGKFQGRKTASGEKFDMYASTAASPFIPLGSLVRVIASWTFLIWWPAVWVFRSKVLPVCEWNFSRCRNVRS
jgi:hypothetical protein